MPKMKNFGLRLPHEQADRIAAVAVERNMLESEILREAIALYLGETIDDTREQLRQLCDRICRIEMMLQNLPRENGQYDGSKEAAACSPVQESPETERPIEIVHHVNMYVNERGEIYCPSCGSFDNEWADDNTDAPVRSIKCNGCDRVSLFDMTN